MLSVGECEKKTFNRMHDKLLEVIIHGQITSIRTVKVNYSIKNKMTEKTSQ